MFLTEYCERMAIKSFEEKRKTRDIPTVYIEGYIEGYIQGYKQGFEEGINLCVALASRLIEAGRFDDIRRMAQDSAYRDRLLREFNLS